MPAFLLASGTTVPIGALFMAMNNGLARLDRRIPEYKLVSTLELSYENERHYREELPRVQLLFLATQEAKQLVANTRNQSVANKSLACASNH